VRAHQTAFLDATGGRPVRNRTRKANAKHESDNAMLLKDLTTSDFVKALADAAPAPGGGSVAAYAGAMAAGLCAMVARLTVGKAKYRDAWDAMDSVIAAAEGLGDRFLQLMDADTDAYNGVVTAFRLPKDGDDRKAARSRAIQDATRRAAEVPLATLNAVAELIPLAAEVVTRGNPNCITDAGTAAHLLRTAAMAAGYNVRINLGGLDDSEFVQECRRQVVELTKEVLARVEKIAGEVNDKLG
jgi:formiminotetrahydrofolate cyclodeaminase